MDYIINEELKFDEQATDEELVTTINQWVKESRSYHDELLEVQKKSIEYYRGNQTDKDDIDAFNSDTVDNRIFAGTETIVPIVTSQSHEFIALPAMESELSFQKSQLIQKVLTRKFEDLFIQEKNEDVLRDLIIKRLGVMKYGWDKNTDDISVEVVDPRSILIPKLKVEAHKLPYVIEVQQYTREEIETEFPDFKNINELKTSQNIETGKDEEKKTYEVLEVWSDDFVVWKSDNLILDKRVNPYFDFEGSEGEEIKFTNHFDNPQKPYIFFTTFRINGFPVGDTSLSEIAIPIQDSINTQKRQIINNLVKMGNGQWILDSDAISEEKRNLLTNEPGLIIEGEALASENKIRREPGVSLPAGHFANLSDSKVEFDALFGVNAATAGRGAAGTLGQDIMNRQQDLTRIDLLTRVLNRGMGRLADGVVQLMKMFYTENHTVKILGEDGAVEFIKFSQNDIEDGVVINVKGGQPLPTDPAFKSNRAIQLWQLQAIAPQDLYKELGIQDPQGTAERLLAWKQGQILMESSARIAEAQAGAQAKVNAQMGTQRGVETPMNSLQRSEQSLGGGTATLPKPPKL